MKLSLPVKLAIAVLVLFGLLFTGMALWKPMKVRYYAAKLNSDDIKVRRHAVRILLNLSTGGPKDQGTNRPVFNYYTDCYSSKDVKKRMAVVDELCACGDKGKAVMKEIFRNWCCSLSQQVKIPAGTLTLENGCKVKIKSFYIDKFEVTKEKYQTLFLCSGFQRDWWPPDFNDRNFQTENNLLLPVSEVLQETAESYAKWLSMRLPTEYEWEYSARAGFTGKYCFGNNASLLNEFGWCESNSDGEPHPIGQKKPNNWGLFDVHGNVFEWCKGLHYHPPHRWFRNRHGNKYRHARGGSFYTTNCDIDTITVMNPNSCRKGIGFRCVRD